MEICTCKRLIIPRFNQRILEDKNRELLIFYIDFADSKYWTIQLSGKNDILRYDFHPFREMNPHPNLQKEFNPEEFKEDLYCVQHYNIFLTNEQLKDFLYFYVKKKSKMLCAQYLTELDFKVEIRDVRRY